MMDNIIVISNAVLWVAVIGLSLLVFALARQVGVLYERVAPAGALMVNQNIKVGMSAPTLELIDINKNTTVITGEGVGRAQLLFFLSPTCPVCKTLLPALKSAEKSEKSWLDLTLASDGPESEHVTFIEKYDLKKYPYVLSERLGKTYGVAKLPYAVLIDNEGKVASMGIINSREHLESLFESMELGIESIQQYMRTDQPDSDVTQADLATELKTS